MSTKSRCQVLSVSLLLLAAVASASAQQASPVDEQALKKEVNAFMDQYWQLWSAGEIDQLAARIYHPFGQLSNQGHSTIDQMKASFPNTRKALVSKGYGRSQMPMPGRNVCILAPNVAVVSGRGVRYPSRRGGAVHAQTAASRPPVWVMTHHCRPAALARVGKCLGVRG